MGCGVSSPAEAVNASNNAKKGIKNNAKPASGQAKQATTGNAQTARNNAKQATLGNPAQPAKIKESKKVSSVKDDDEDKDEDISVGAVNIPQIMIRGPTVRYY